MAARPAAGHNGMDPGQNWGLAVPPVMYQAVVPRPPQPAAVGLAFMLSYVGVALAVLFLLAQLFLQWSRRAELTGSLQQPGVDTSQMTDGFAIFVIALTALYWVAVAAGVVVCTRLAQRGRNAPRIVLAVLAGVMALNHLCGIGAGSLALLMRDRLATDTSATSQALSRALAVQPWWGMVGQGALGSIAGTMFVLLILPVANRYFAPGPGRRFATDH